MVFTYGQWLRLPINTRHIIATAFGITKKLPTHVQGDRIVADGYDIEEIEKSLTLESLQTYLNTNETDFNVLWDMLTAKTEGRVVDTQPVTVDDNVAQTVLVQAINNAPIKKKRGRPSKK